MPRSVVLNFWNASIVKIMKLNGLDLEKCELLLSFLGQQTTFYRVFILKERRQLLFKDIKEVLECNDEVANILVEEFFKLPEHPTTYDSVIRDLINALLGSDEDIMFEKAKAFFEVYEDVPGAAEHPELDSREFFSIIANKFKEIDRKDNLKLESVLFDVLLRIVQREASLKHAIEFDLIPHLLHIIFSSTPYPISYLRQITHSTTPLSQDAVRMIKEGDGLATYASPIHSPQSLASVLEVLGKLVQSSDYRCQYAFFSNYGVYILLNLASVYIMEIRKGGNYRLYSGTNEDVYDTTESLYVSPKKRSSSPSKLAVEDAPTTTATTRDRSRPLKIYPSFPYLFLIPSLCLTCISSLFIGSLAAQKQFVRMGGLSVAFAGLKCSVAVRSSAVKMSEEEEGEDVYLENEKPAEEDNDFDIAFSKRKNPKVIYVGEFTHEYIDGNLPADFDDEDDNISSAYFISSTRLLYTETSSSDAVTLVDPSLYPSLSRASVCYNERILLITSTTSLLFSLLLDFHKRCKMIKRAPLPVSHSPQSSFSQASKESMSKKGSISSPLSRLSMGGGYSVGESKPKQEQTETRKLGAAEEDDYLVEMVVSYDENSIILCLEQGLFTTLIYLLSKIEIFLTSVDSSISNIALNTPWITPFVSSSLFLITSLKVSLNASSPPCTSAFSFSFAPSTSLSFWTSPTPSSFLSHLLSFLFSFLYYKFIPALISSIYSVLYDKKDPNILDPFSMEGFQMFEYSEASKSEKSPYVVLNYLLALHSVVHLVSGNNSINYTQITSSFPLYLSPSLLGDISSSLYSYSGCYDTTIQTSVEQEDVSTIVLSKELNCDDNFISNPPPIGLFLITTALVNSNVLTVLLHLLLLYGLPTSLTSAVAQNDYTKSFTEEQEDKKSITISLTFAFIITHIFSFFSVTPDLAYAISQHPLSVSTLLDVLYSYYRYWKRYSVECENKNESDEGEIDRLSSLPSSPPILTPLMLHLTKKVLVDIVLKNYDDEINLKHLVKNITIIHTINVMRQSIVEIAILKKIVKEGLEEERKKKEKAFLYSEIYDISLLHSLLQLTLCLFLPVPPPPGGFEIKTQDPNSSKTSIDCASTRSSVASHLSISSRGTTNLARNALSAAKSHQTLPYLLQSVIIATLITNGIVETVLPVYAGLPLAVTRVGAEEEDRVVEDVTAKDEDVVDGTQININLVSATSLSTYSTEKKKIENVAKTVLLQLGIKGSPFYFQIFNAIIPPSSEKVEQEKIDSISNIFSSSSFLSYFSLHLLVPYAFNIFILLLSSSTVVSNMNRLGFIKMNGPLLSLSTLSSYSSITASAPLLEMCNILFKRIDGLKGEQSIANVVFTDVEATITTEDNVSVPIKYQCTPILRKRYVYFDLFDDYLDLYKQKLLAYKNYLKKQVLDKIDISSEQSGKPPGKRGRINLSEQTPVSSEERSAKVVKKEKEIYDKITMLNSILFSTSVSLETSLTSATQPSSDMSLYLLSFESLRLITYVFSLLQSSTTTTANQVSSNSISLESGTALPALLTYARNIMVSCGVNPDLFSPTSTDDTFIQSRNIILSSSLSSSPLLSLASSLAYFSISRIILSVSASTTQNAFFLLNMDINNATVSLLSSSLYYYLALLPRIGGSFYTFDEEGGNFTTVSVTDCNFNFYFTSSLSTVYFNILTSIIETLSFLCLAPPPSSSSNIPTSSFPLNSFLSSSILSLLLVLPPPLLTKYVLPSAVKDMVNEDGDLEILKDDQIESTINPHKFRTHKRVLSVSTNPFQSGASISTLNSIIPTNLTTKETKAKGLTTAPGAFLRPYYILPSSPAPSTDPLLLSSPFSSLSLLQLSHRLFCFIVRLTTSTSSSASASLLQIVIQKIKEKIDISLNSSSTSQDSPSFSSLPHLSLLLFIHFLLPTLTPPPSTTPGVSTTGSVISYRSTATRQSTSEASALSITTASVSQRRRTNRENRARMRSLFFSAFPVFASCLHLVVGLLRTVKELSTKQYTGSSAKSKRPSFLYTYLKILLEIIGNIVRNSREMQLTTASTSAVDADEKAKRERKEAKQQASGLPSVVSPVVYLSASFVQDLSFLTSGVFDCLNQDLSDMSNPSTPSSDNNFEDVCVIPSVCKACGCVFCCDIYSKIVPTLVVLGRKVIVSFMYLINDIINKYQRSIALKNVIHSISLIVDGEKFISLLFNILFSPISSSLVPESLKPGTSDDVEYSSLSSLKQTKPKKERKTMREKEIEADLGKSGIIPKIVTIFSLSSAYLLPSLNSNSFLPKYPPLNLESTDLYGQSKVLPFIPVEFITSLLWLPSTQAIFSHCEIYALPTVTNLFMDITQTVYKQIHEEPQENCKGEFEIQVDSTEKSDITNQLLLLSFDTHTRGFASLKALLTLITIFVSSSLERHVSSPSQSTQPSVNKAPSSLSSAFDAPPAVAGEIKTPLTGEVFFSFVPQNPVSPQQALLQFSITASSTPKPLPFSLVSFLCSLLASLKSFIVLVNLLTVRDLKRNFQTQDSSEDEKKFDRSVSLVPTILNGLSLLYETVSSGMINPTKGFVATSTATSSYKFNPMLSIGTSLNDYICSSGMLFSLVESLSALFVTNLFVNEVNKASDAAETISPIYSALNDEVIRISYYFKKRPNIRLIQSPEDTAEVSASIHNVLLNLVLLFGLTNQRNLGIFISLIEKSSMTLKVLSNKVYNPNSSNDPAINAILISSLSSLFNPPNNNVFNPFYHSCFVNMFILRLSLTYLLESFTFLHIPFTYSSKIHQTGESNPWLDATATTFNYLISTSQFTLNPSTKISLSSLFSPQFLYSLKANKAVQDDSDSQNTPSLIRNSEKLLYFYRQGGVKVLLDALMITSKTEWWFEDKGFDDDDHKAEISSDNLSDDDDINALSPILPVSLLIDPVSSTLLSLILSLFSPSIITSEITRPSLPTSTKTSGPNGDLNKTGSTSSNVEVMTEADVLSLDMVDYKSYAEEVVDDHGVTTVVRALTREVCLLGKYGDGGELDEKQIKAYQDGILSGFKTEVYELLNNERSVIKKMEKIDENDGDIKVNGEEPEMEEEVEEEGEEIEKGVEVGLLDEEKKEKKKKVIKVVKKKPKEISDADLSINLVPKSKKLIKKINEYMSSFNIPLFSLQTLSRPSDTRKDNTQILLKRSVYASDRSDEKNDTSQAVAQAEEKIQLNAPLTVTSSTASFIQSSFAFLLSLISSNTVITATAFSGDLMHIFERWKGIGLGFTEGSTAITDTETSVMLFVVLAHCLNILNTEDGYYIYAPDKTLKKNQQQNAGDGAIRRMASVSRTPSFVSGAPVVGDTTSKPTQVGTQTSRLMSFSRASSFVVPGAHNKITTSSTFVVLFGKPEAISAFSSPLHLNPPPSLRNVKTIQSISYDDSGGDTQVSTQKLSYELVKYIPPTLSPHVTRRLHILHSTGLIRVLWLILSGLLVKYYQTTQKNSLEQLGVKPLVYLKSALSTLSNYVLKTISNVGHPGSDLHGDLPIPVNDAGSSTLFTSEDWLKAMNGLGYIDAYVDCNFTAWDKERFTHPFLYSLTNPLKYSLLWISNIFHILLLVPPIILPKPETDASLLTGQTTVTSRSLTTTVTITTRPKKAKEKKYNKMLQALTGGLVVPPSIDTAAGASLIIPPPNEITNVIEQIRDNQIEGKLLYLQNCGDGSWSGAVKGSEAAMLDQTAPLEKKKTPYWEHLLLDETDSFLSYARISPIGVGGGGGGGGYGQMDDMGTMREGGGVISYIAVITSVDKSLWLITEYPGTSPDDVEIDKVIIRRKSVNEEKVEPKKVEVDVDGEEPLPEVEIFDDPNVIPLEFISVKAGHHFFLAQTLDGCLVSFGSNEFGECGRGDGNEDGMEGDATLEIRTENVMKNKDLKNKIDYERVKKRKKWLDWGFVVGFDGQKSGGSTVMNRTQGLLSGEGSGSSTPGGSNTPGSSIGSALVSSGGANRVVSYSCGAYHAVAVTQFGQVYTWGKNESGQLGIPLNGNTVSGMIQQTGGLSTGSVGGLKRSELVSSGGSLKRSELGEKGKGIKKSNEVLEFDLPPSFVDVPNEITNNVYISLINSNNSSYSSAVASRADLSLTAALVYTNTEHLYSRLEQETIQELEDEGKVVGAGGSLVYGKRKDIPFTVMELSNDMSSSAAVRSLLNRSASPSKTRFSVSPPPTSSSSSSSSASSASSAPVADPFNIALTSHPNGSYSRSNSVVSCGYGMTKKVSSYSYGVFGPYKIISAAAGVHHTLFLTSDGRIFVCGKNIVGQLGIPPRLLPSSSLYNPMLLPQVLFNNKKISCIYAGSFHSGCLTSQGELYTWGMNNNGQCTVSSNTITERKYGSMIPTAEGNVSCIPAPFNVSELIKKRKAKLNEKLRKKELKNKKKKAAKGIYEEEDDDLDIFGENLEVIILNIKALMDESDFIVDVGMSDFSTFILFSSGKVFCCGEGSNVENVINKENTLSLDHADEDVEATPKRDPLKSPEPNRRSQSPTKFASSLYFRPSSLPKPSLLLYKGSSLVDVSATIADTLNSEITLEEEEKDEEIEVEKVEFKTTKILGGRCYMGLLVI